ncbi:MAG: hypothetical protein HUK25_00390 [Treponema sp.]|nr:hypothetical protein [Treponema sp.]
MKKCNFFPKIFFFFSLLFLSFFSYAETEKSWTIAAQKFNLKSSNITAVENALTEMIPRQILSNLSGSSIRTISADEEYERESYKLKNERISLFLQLDAAVKTRDSIFLQNYSEKTLALKLKDEEKKIQEIKNKINENLNKCNQAEEKRLKSVSKNTDSKELSEGQKFINLFKGFLNTDSDELKNEKVVLYTNSSSGLFEPSESAATKGTSSHIFQKELLGSGINSLLKGDIYIIGDFLSVTAELLVYPGAKSSGVVTEIGNISDIDYISSSIANSLAPLISSSLPVEIMVLVEPEEAQKQVTFSIDDNVYKSVSEKFIVDSGVHTIRLSSPGYKDCITSYFFDGNGKYIIQVEMKEAVKTVVNLRAVKQLNGQLFANGELAATLTDENNIAEIKINDSKIFGQFISSEGGSGFFYIPEKLIIEENNLTIKPKTYNRGEYIDLRRKVMYVSYSAFLVSVLATMFTAGNFSNYSTAYTQYPNAQRTLYDETKAWKDAANISIGITIGTGVFFGYELVRYFIAADSVLPVKAKQDKSVKNLDTISEKENLEKDDFSVQDETEKNETDEINENELISGELNIGSEVLKEEQ